MPRVRRVCSRILFLKRAMALGALRHQRFGPLHGGAQSLTPTLRRKGQHPLFGLVFLPLSAHESHCLLAFPFIPLTGTVRAFLRGSGVLRPLLTSTTWSG